MKIFVDSAKLDEIKKAYSYGVVDGVTTNPSLIKQAVEDLKAKGENIDMVTYIKQILEVAKGTPVSLEVTETNGEKMYAQAKKIYTMFNSVAENVVIKIPVNPSSQEGDGIDFHGVAVIKKLAAEGIPVNCTLVFTPEQALLAAKAGAKYVSPFAGRIDDYIRKQNNIEFDKSDYYDAEGMSLADFEAEEGAEEEGVDDQDDAILNDEGIVSGVDLVKQCVEIFDEYDMKCEVLAASTRNTRQVRECALVGAHVATIPYSVIKNLLKHPKTMEGMIAFTKDIVPEYAEILK